MNESADLKLRFSSGFKFVTIPQTVKNINIDAQYSDVSLPMNTNNNFDFDVTVHYGGFKFPSDKMTLTVNPDKEEEGKNNWSPKFTKTYKGKIGKGGGKLTYTQVFGDWLCDMAKADNRLVAITPAMREDRKSVV